MNVLQQKEAEIEALKSQLKKQADEIASLKKQNEWYIEQLKLRQKEKFGVSSEKADENQMTLFDLIKLLESSLRALSNNLISVLKDRTQDAHARVRKIVAKEQRHSCGAKV